MSVETARAVRKMMQRVVSDKGTGKRASVANYSVAGKTGTVHKFIAGGYAEDRYLSIFAGMVPADKPELVMVVMVDEPRNGEHFGGLVAAPVFQSGDVRGYASAGYRTRQDIQEAVDECRYTYSEKSRKHRAGRYNEQNEVALDFLLEGFIDDALVEQCRDLTVNGLVQDNRKARSGNLFFAHQGYNTHGLLYAQDAVAKGVTVVLWDGDVDNRDEILDSISNKVLCIHCEDLKYKVGPIASRYYEQPSLSLNTIGVTGTDGKTSIAHFLAQCLDAYDVHCGILGTLGNGFINDLHPTGLTTADALLVQKTLAEIQQAGARHVVMEVSSHGLDQGRVSGVAFTTAVFSNMAADHLDYHGTLDNYAAAKKRLFYTPGLGAAVINLDDEFGRQLAKEVRENVCVWGYSLRKRCVRILKILLIILSMRLEIKPFEHGYHLSVATPKGRGQFRSATAGPF